MTQPVAPIRVRAARSDKSADRIAIEKALQDAGKPLTRQQISVRCSIDAHKVSVVLGNLCAGGWAHRLPPFGAETDSRFGWGGSATTEPAGARPARPSYTPTGYDGRELQAFSGRPGAMDAFALPSLLNGERVQRRAPVIMGCTPSPRTKV